MQTVDSIGESLYKEKGSKFIGIALHVSSREEVESALADIRKQFPDARHICYAYSLGPKSAEYRANDDGEPSGSAGQPILRQLNSFNTTDTLVAVVRYFGGTKLGVGGLITAYKTAARDALSDAQLVERVEWKKFTLRVSYQDVGRLQQIVNREKLTPVQTDSHDTGMTMKFKVAMADYERLLPLLQKLGTLSYD